MTADVRDAWRTLFPHLPPAGVVSLRTALAADDPRLVQGASVVPMMLIRNYREPICAADAVLFALWQGSDNAKTVGDIDLALEDLYTMRLGPALKLVNNHWDDTPRERARVELAELLDEVADCETTPALPCSS
jgi:hypothetical protein